MLLGTGVVRTCENRMENWSFLPHFCFGHHFQRFQAMGRHLQITSHISSKRIHPSHAQGWPSILVFPAVISYLLACRAGYAEAGSADIGFYLGQSQSFLHEDIHTKFSQKQTSVHQICSYLFAGPEALIG